MEAYGGVRISETAIRSLTDALKTGSVPFGLHHDPRHRLNAGVVDAFTRHSEDGELQAVVVLEVDESEWAENGGGNATGLSVSTRRLLFGERKATPTVTIAADAQWFSDQQIEAAFRDLSTALGAAHGCRLYQFALEPPAVVALVVTLQQMCTVPATLLSSYIYDGLKHFVAREPSIFNVTVTYEQTGKTTDVYLETASDEVLKHAISILARVFDHGGEYDYSTDAEDWMPRN